MRQAVFAAASFAALMAAMLVLPAFAGAPADRGVRVMPAAIPMPDGVLLAATLYMPADLRPHERVPALLEYLPYRKDDDTVSGDYGKHAYFARHGYVGVRVDIRGFGASGGTPPTREYSAQEQEDGEHVIAWLARQPWSNGNVGMFGISWGGFNSIQMAMRRPPALKAILAIAATEALFKEDVHYMDGVMHVDEFEVSMDLDQGRSGAPGFPLDEDALARRMDSTPWSLDYFRHQRDGAFWRAPIRRFEDIRIPCFLIGGLQDGYRDSIPRMLERVPAPVRAWLGPWNHDYPNTRESTTASSASRVSSSTSSARIRRAPPRRTSRASGAPNRGRRRTSNPSPGSSPPITNSRPRPRPQRAIICGTFHRPAPRRAFGGANCSPTSVRLTPTV